MPPAVFNLVEEGIHHGTKSGIRQFLEFLRSRSWIETANDTWQQEKFTTVLKSLLTKVIMVSLVGLLTTTRKIAPVVCRVILTEFQKEYLICPTSSEV